MGLLFLVKAMSFKGVLLITSSLFTRSVTYSNVIIFFGFGFIYRIGLISLMLFNDLYMKLYIVN